MDERDMPRRDEIESLIWALNQGQSSPQEKIDMLTTFLHERGVPDREIDRILEDLPSYKNWVTEDAERSTTADNG